MSILLRFYMIIAILSQLTSWSVDTFVPDFHIQYSSENFYDSAADIENPYQGFYYICGFTISENRSDDSKIDNYLAKSINNPIVLVEFNLKNYRNTPVGEQGLAQIDYILSRFSEAGKCIIVRFLYDWDGKAQNTEPDNISTVTTHMDQTASIINRHSDYVYLLQGLFIGHWGEIHGSKFSGNDDLSYLLKHLASVTDSSIYLSVRTPAHWRTVMDLYDIPDDFPAFLGQNLSEITSDSLVLMSRLGLFNDGMMASESDLGTYGSTLRAEATIPGYNGVRAEELLFQNILCNYVPNGGEVVYDTPYNDLDNAISTLSEMHVSYLNEYYDTAAINKWKSSTYHNTDCFDLCDGFYYIKNHLGYRYSITSSEISFKKVFTEQSYLYFTLSNCGFASTPRNFRTTVLLIGTDNDYYNEVDADCNLCLLKSNTDSTYSVELPITECPDGSYKIYLKVKDEQINRNIIFANTNELTEYGYLLGTLSKTSTE